MTLRTRAAPAQGSGGAPVVAFSYHRAVAPMLWVLVALGSAELLVVHLLLALLWSGTAALVASLVTGAALLWLAAEIRGFRRRPVLLGPDTLLWRTGRLRRLAVPRDAILGPCEVPPAAMLKARHVANFALVAHPNVALALSRPVGPRGVTLVAHRLDDPAAFLAAVVQLDVNVRSS